MNYIELIRAFWRSHEEHSFSTTEIALYFHLVEVCNICHWKNPFKRNNSKIGADLGISFNTLKNARNRLAQCGIISFRTVNGSPNVTYTLSKYDEVTNEVGVNVGDGFPKMDDLVKNSQGYSRGFYEVGTEVTNEVGAEVLPTKDKLNINKTKPNIIDNPLPPEGESGCDDECLEPTDPEKEKSSAKKEKALNVPFDEFWDAYGKKVGSREKLGKKWLTLTDADRAAIMDHIPAYVLATPDKQYRKNPQTFLNNRSWEDEIIKKNNGKKSKGLKPGGVEPNLKGRGYGQL